MTISVDMNVKDQHPQTHGQESDLEEEEDKSFIEEIKIYFRNYCNHTGIHGFQYFGQHRTLIEKIWWVLVFVATFSACSFCIYLIYEKWATSPVIVSLATKETPIYHIPFPAVTICPTIKYSRKCFEEYENQTNSGMKAKLAGYAQSICKRNLDSVEDTVSKERFYTDHYFSMLLKCSPFANKSFNVKFMNEKDLEFRDVFHPIITEDGVCFSFNMLSLKEIFSSQVVLYSGLGDSDTKSSWIPQDGYPEEAELYTYPRRALLAGGINSLEITMTHKEDDIDYECTGAEQGYKVLLHIPCRLARPALEYIMVPFNKATTITVIPEIMATSKRVKKYNAESRSCFFPGEKHLKYFEVYTKNSCDMECLTNFTLQFCKCVAFWMPRQSSTPICGPAQLGCINVAREDYDLSKLKDKLEEDRLRRKLAAAKTNKTLTSFQFWDRDKEEAADETIKDLEDEITTVKSKCNCFPMCSDLTYIGTASSLDFRWNEETNQKYSTKTILKNNLGRTQINIFIKTNEVFTRERNELYGPTDFISNFGGLLGLFSGFSILSFMEIIYYLTLRIIGNWKKFGRWYGKED